MSKNSIPPIKFKTFLNHWSNTELKEVKDVRDGTHSSPKYIDNGYPLVTSKNLTDSGLNLNDVSLISESDYNEINKRSKVEVGDILLGLIGTIGKPVLVETDGFAIKNVGLIKNGGQIQNQFLLQYLKTNLFNKYIQIEMAGNTQKFLGLETLRNTKVPVPSSEEQSAIGSLFRTLDDLLASYKDNLANYQSLKATMLSKMFPKAGQTVPEIRLDGFEDEWEKARLKDVTESIEYGLNASAKEFDGENKYIRITDIDDVSRKFKEDSLTSPDINVSECDNYLLCEKDILFARTGASVGKTYLYGMKDGKVYFAGFLIRARIKEKCDSKFIFQNTLTNRFTQYVKVTSQRSGQPGVNGKEYGEYELFLPKYKEQQAIGTYFSNLDNLISAHQEKISQLETLKKKLLQDMFI